MTASQWLEAVGLGLDKPPSYFSPVPYFRSEQNAIDAALAEAVAAEEQAQAAAATVVAWSFPHGRAQVKSAGGLRAGVGVTAGTPPPVPAEGGAMVAERVSLLRLLDSDVRGAHAEYLLAVERQLAEADLRVHRYMKAQEYVLSESCLRERPVVPMLSAGRKPREKHGYALYGRHI